MKVPIPSNRRHGVIPLLGYSSGRQFYKSSCKCCKWKITAFKEFLKLAHRIPVVKSSYTIKRTTCNHQLRLPSVQRTNLRGYPTKKINEYPLETAHFKRKLMIFFQPLFFRGYVSVLGCIFFFGGGWDLFSMEICLPWRRWTRKQKRKQWLKTPESCWILRVLN